MSLTKRLILFLLVVVSIWAAAQADDAFIEDLGDLEDAAVTVLASIRGVSSFYLQSRISCKKDPAICFRDGSPGAYCCKKTCVDIKTDTRNCGTCKNQCNHKSICCEGFCVLASTGCKTLKLV